MLDPNHYNYELPQELLAQEPASPRDSSRIFVYDTATDTIQFDHFFHLHKYLPQNSFLTVNTTKVLPSRIILYKENRGRVKTLFLVNEMKENVVKAMVDRGLSIGQRLNIDQKYWFTVIGQNEHIFTLSVDFPKEDFIKLLEKKGSMPIPPYLKKSTLTEGELRRKYQTVFATDRGSAAAPTASLHFTPRVFKKLEQKGIGRETIKLHVGAGTFAPLTEKNLKEKTLHTEWYEITPQAAERINTLKNAGNKLVAVGTTVTRALESAAETSGVSKSILTARTEETNIFIFPPYKFKMVDILVTNFHVPKSSLMMLVDAFLENKKSSKSLLELYQIAIKEKFWFFSFGEAMVIL
jgi:S-adenosylmethionine:tRNA ribosyltransferase-isomerase